MSEQTSQKVDLRGLTCPEPVIRTKKLMDLPATQEVEALVDDQVCVNNLQRLARSLKASFAVVEQSGSFAVTLCKGGAKPQDSLHVHTTPRESNAPSNNVQDRTGTVVFISKDAFGEGDPDFSKTLLNLFLQTMFDSGLRPRAILMANSGVRLMAKSSQTLKVLEDFRNAGCEVLACGLCVDYYKLKEDIPTAQITNMFAICEYLFAADKLIQP